jgi:hypothetical protein
VNEEDFETVLTRMSGAKAAIMKRQMDLLVRQLGKLPQIERRRP